MSDLFQLDSVIYCTLTSVRDQLSQLGFLSVVNLSVDYGLHLVKLDSLIQFEWPPWEFESSWNSCFYMIIVDPDLCVNEMKEHIQNHNNRHFANITEIQ